MKIWLVRFDAPDFEDTTLHSTQERAQHYCDWFREHNELRIDHQTIVSLEEYELDAGDE